MQLKSCRPNRMSDQAHPTNVQRNALCVAWLVALVSTLVALFIGEVMGRTPCTLCWYQRIAMFPLALILGFAAYSAEMSVRRYVVPIAVIGGLIAVWHSLLFAGVVPEPIQPCSKGGPSCTGDEQILLGVLPMPFLSTVAFAAIILLLTVPFRKAAK
jgi:disulfide bond formation protein DsbB